MSDSNELLLEGQELIETFSRLLFEIEDQLREGEELDPDKLNESFRAIHTLKSLAGLASLEPLEKFAHEVETSLNALRLGQARLDAELLNHLFETANAFEQLLRGAGINTGALLAKLARKVAAPSDTVELDLDWLDPTILGTLTEFEEHRLRENLRIGRRIFRVEVEFDLLSFGEGIDAIKAELKRCGEVITLLPSVGGGDLERMGFAIFVGSMAPEAEIAEIAAAQGGTVELLGGAAAPAPAKSRAEEPEPEADLSLLGDPSEGSATSLSQTVRVDLRRLDLLMNLVGELGLVHANFDACAARVRDDPSADVLRELQGQLRTMGRRVAELQQGILDVRMVPVRHTFDQVQRLVQRANRERVKRIRMQFSGTETELDKQIGEKLSKPLVHMINNAIAHGIESPAEREAAGKPAVGRIALRAYQKGNRVVIEVSDDGKGIDWRMIRDKALEKGVISAGEAADMDPVRAINLIFQHGFSSKDEADQRSGRGVGMDVVKHEIAKLSGMIDVATEPGKGTRFRVTLPSTMAIVQALVIESAGQTFCIQLNSVLESLMVRAEEVMSIEGCAVISVRGRTLPLLDLAEVFELARAGQVAPSRARGQLYVVVVGLAEHRVGLVVDELLGQRDVVIKPLGRALGQIPGIAGATELGDHRTVLLLDVATLVAEAVGGEATLAGGGGLGSEGIRVSTRLA